MVANRTRAVLLAAVVPAALLVGVRNVAAFSPAGRLHWPKAYRPRDYQHQPTTVHHRATSLSLSSSDIQAKLKAQMAKLQERDRSSKAISSDVSVEFHMPSVLAPNPKPNIPLLHINTYLTFYHNLLVQELDVVYEDEHIAVINKPSGVLTVPGKEDNPSLNKAVFERFGCESGRMDKMVVHRLGMDTSGLVVFARTNAALRELNSLFRTRKVTRKYEALVCGHVANDAGVISLPLMRDYECPPYMRVSTDEHQKALIGLDPEEVGKKILESPKPSTTEYEVMAREDLDGKDVTRLALTSVSGRTHQLNVHCAAFGHPIVGDEVYGYGGEAAANGGIEASELPDDSASEDLQKDIAEAVAGKPMCVHAKLLSFEHPITREKLAFECGAPF